VSKSGSSTPPYTSWETAADSIQKCINLCVNGDTIYVANGVYKENLVINTALNLIGSSMDSTVIDGREMLDYTVVFNSSGYIGNFNVYGKSDNALTSRVIRCNNIYSNLVIENCNLRNSGVGVSMVGGDVIAKNLSIKNVTRGFNVFGHQENVIENCVVVLDKVNAIGVSIGFSTNIDHYIRNNIILFTGSYNPGNGISIGAPRRVLINNNLISGFADNIFIDSPQDTVIIINNILNYQFVVGGYPASINAGNNRFKVRNVILARNKYAIIASGSPKIDYNVFWKNQKNLIGVIYGDSDIVADPMFVKDTIPTADGNYDFHLQAYSPAIDKGDPNILDLDGTRSDIGLYGGPFGETYNYEDLAPLAPRNLSAIVDSNTILVKWNKNTEADTAYYKVYRDTVSGFTIDSTKLVSSSKDTFFVQVNPHNVRRYVYKVTCVDKQGNESKPSTELVVNITSVSMNDYPMTISDYQLYQNYPNPFNPSTKIGYQLKERAYVKLMVYDIKGELVSVLVNKEQNAGYYEVEFNVGNGLPSVPDIQGLASGIYLYRIEVIGEGRIPVYTEMKKMLLIK
jgi:nitrous oxidase accessory protein NosD